MTNYRKEIEKSSDDYYLNLSNFRDTFVPEKPHFYWKELFEATVIIVGALALTWMFWD
jgi:hypothetical protein